MGNQVPQYTATSLHYNQTFALWMSYKTWQCYIYIYTIALTCNLRLGFYPGEILRPERGYRASELKVGGVATVGMEVGGSIVDNLLRLNLIGYLSLVVGTSFKETGPGKLLWTTGNHSEIDGTTVHRDIWLQNRAQENEQPLTKTARYR